MGYFNTLEEIRMKYEVAFTGKRYGGAFRQTFPNYTAAWRYGEKLRKENIVFIINPIHNV